MDESRENSPAKYNDKISNTTITTPTTRTMPMPTTSSGKIGVDNSGLDVDFPKVFVHMQKEEPLF